MKSYQFTIVIAPKGKETLPTQKKVLIRSNSMFEGIKDLEELYPYCDVTKAEKI